MYKSQIEEVLPWLNIKKKKWSSIQGPNAQDIFLLRETMKANLDLILKGYFTEIQPAF